MALILSVQVDESVHLQTPVQPLTPRSRYTYLQYSRRFLDASLLVYTQHLELASVLTTITINQFHLFNPDFPFLFHHNLGPHSLETLGKAGTSDLKFT